jgi:biopolymer transport protein ExbB
MNMDLINLPAFAAALEVSRYFAKWNMILVLLGCCSIISVTVFIERLLQLNKAAIDTNAFVIKMRKMIKERNIVEAIQACEDTGGSIANIIKKGLLKHNLSRDRVENAMETQGLLEVSYLEKNAKVLSVIAYIAPLIGLLGTVLGFIQAFGEMRQTGLMDISTTNIGEAMEYALITTAAGLVVAIPTVVGYNYIVSRIEGLVLEMQTTSSEIVDLLLNQNAGHEGYF